MSREIEIVLPHQLGVEEARKRVADAVERARAGFAESVVDSDVTWDANRAAISVGAFGQRVEGQIDVEPAQVRVRVQLPWLLASLAGKITDRLTKVGGDALRLGYDPTRPRT
ncbi:MAG: hypothetical protein JWN93_3704 [Hyphomicrobiales bacterium]|nr:hypothetical protein [Hyphomicrobiales bacterium]